MNDIRQPNNRNKSVLRKTWTVSLFDVVFDFSKLLILGWCYLYICCDKFLTKQKN